MTDTAKRCPQGCPSQYWTDLFVVDEWVGECERCGYVQDQQAAAEAQAVEAEEAKEGDLFYRLS